MSRRMVEPPSEDLLRGPFEPDSMTPKFRLDSAQGARYRAAWDSMMAATRPARDSIRAAMATRRRARTEGFARETERQQKVTRDLAKQLKKEEERFDRVIRRFLSEDQWEDFKDWRTRRRETERDLRRQQMMEGGMMGPPGADGGRPRRG